MEKFNILKDEKYNVGNIQKQRINITTKTKGKPLDQADIKNIVKMINEKYIRDKKNKLKYLCVVYHAASAHAGRDGSTGLRPFCRGRDIFNRRIEPDIDNLALHPRPRLISAHHGHAPV